MSLHDLVKEFEGKIGEALKQGTAWAVTELLQREPDRFFATLRALRPILASPQQGPIFVTLFADVQEVLSRPEVFTVRSYAPKMDPSVGPFMLARDGTTINDRDKGIMRSLLRREDLPRVREIVARLTARAIQEGAKAGRLEVVSAVSRRVPVELTGEYFGFPGPDRASMLRWSRATQYDMFHNLTNDPAIHQDNVRAGAEMTEYLRAYIPQRRRELEQKPDGDDVLSRLLRMQLPEEVGFDEERVRANTMGLLVGGVETTSAAIVQLLDQLLSRPAVLTAAQAAARAGDTALLSQYCWEALRFNPINPFVVRICVSPYRIASGTERATTVPAGATVFASTRSAMMDERELHDPGEFKLDRPPYHYMHLGYGLHTCLGEHVSGVQVPEIVGQLLRLPGLRRAPGPEGQLDVDLQRKPFPERFVVEFDA